MTDPRNLAGVNLLLDEATIARHVRRLGEAIARDHAASGEVVLVGVLRGAFVFLADLARAVAMPTLVDFVAVETYRGQDAGRSQLVLDLRLDIAGRDVVLVEDIVDTGRTLALLMSHLEQRKPRRLRTCCLLSKPSRRELEIALDYVGCEVEDHWIVGYGLDYNGGLRGLPYLATLPAVES